jgi:hypothetical protein
MMDQLRSDLAEADVHALPAGWQFVHIDVPTAPDGLPGGLTNVRDQGGAYFGAGPQNGNYAEMDRTVAHRLTLKNGLEHVATWAPRDPQAVDTPISEGAGQYRAIGRMITLSNVVEIDRVLNSALNRLDAQQTITEMTRLDVPGLGRYDEATQPMVIVVSSMAGGAGASMALDVCRILTTDTRVSANLVGVFMLACNVFGKTAAANTPGVGPNSLAMLGEIVATQTGAARRHDKALLEALGLGAGGAEIPFARVFPVGRFSGAQRTEFGDGTAEAVYRGLGRGLAALVMSETATEQFIAYDLANRESPTGDTRLLGWGSEPSSMAWGSYGYACLSMGRDRYREYAAQRIARTAVDRLLGGHLQQGVELSSIEQVRALLESQWPALCTQRLRLPALTGPPERADEDVRTWLFVDEFTQGDGLTAARAVVAKTIVGQIAEAHGVESAVWVATVRNQLAQRRSILTTEVRHRAAEWAYRWHTGLLERTEAMTEAAVATVGLPYAIAFVERLSRHLRELLAPLAQHIGSYAATDIAAFPEGLEKFVAAQPRGRLQNGSQLQDVVREQYEEQVYHHINAHAALLVGQLLVDMSTRVLAPLVAALREAQRRLEVQLSLQVSDAGLARLATDHVALWPRPHEGVPERFAHADNEILLTDTATFGEQYDADVRGAGSSGVPRTPGEALSEVVTQVISGKWTTTGSQQAPRALVERLDEWRTEVFPVNPLDESEQILPRTARYDVRLRPAELLGRARAFVARPGESFDKFCRVSIRDFAIGDDVAANKRRELLTSKFAEALRTAQPLISVDSTALQIMHDGRRVRYRYKFSEAPLQGNAEVVENLTRVIQNNPDIDDSSLPNFRKALGNGEAVTRIHIFGSYPNYSPLVFDAVLVPVAKQWAATGGAGHDAFWQWRRCRPLSAALPLGDNERRTMVKGWLVGQIVGQIRIPERHRLGNPVQIWDRENSEWVPFPHPLLTPPTQFLDPNDWLPAVLESSLLAVARSHERPVMASMRPYQLLRELYDDAPNERKGGIQGVSAEDLLAEWVQEGTTPPGGESRVRDRGGASSPEQRLEAADQWLGRIGDLVRTHYLSPQDGGEKLSPMTLRRQASEAPMIRDVAPDVVGAADELRALLEKRTTGGPDF